MKNFWIAVLATPLLASASSTYRPLWAQQAPSAPPSTSGTSVALANAGFEGAFKSVDSRSDSDNATARISGQVGEGWGDNSNWAPVTVTYARDATNPHRGSASQRVEISRVDGGAVQFVNPVTVKKGRVYEARVWLRGQSGQSVNVSLRRAGAPYNQYSDQTLALSPEWKEMRLLAPTAEDADAFVMIRATSLQTFWVDDASLVDVTDVASSGAPKVGNQLSNGSFETNRLPFGWSARFQGDQEFQYRDPRPVMDRLNPASGSQSLRLDVPRGASVAVHSPVAQPNYARPHAMSVWMRAARPVSAQLHLENTDLSASHQVTTQWQRFELRGTLPFRLWTQARISLSEQEEPNTLWIDGVSLEESEAPSGTYRPGAALEMTIELDTPGKIVFDKQKVPVALSIAGDLPRGAVLARSVEDLRGRVTKLPPLALPLKTSSFSLPEMNGARGMWKMRAQVLGARGAALSDRAELIWARLPRPKVLAPAKSYFGLHVPLSERYVKMGLALGAKWTRLHDTSMIAKWSVAEPEPGRLRFYDPGVTLTKKLGMNILGMMDGAPRWAATKPREGGYWGIWHIPDAPGAADAWERYCQTMAEHYKGRIDTWEVWNEPWGEWFLGAGGQPDLYADLMTRAYRALKKGNPNGTLIGVDTYPGSDEKWTIPVLEKAGTDDFDAISFHEYNDSLFGGPSAIPFGRVSTLNALMQKHGASTGGRKPIWNTEGGVFQLGSWYAPVTGGMSPDAQGAYMVRYDVAMMGAGVQKFFLYALHTDAPMGSVETRVSEVGDAIKPILGARAVLASLVDGVGTPRRDEPVRGVDRYNFSNGVQVLWSFDGADHTLNVPRDRKALDLWGNALAGSTVRVGVEPRYLVRK